MNTISHDLHVHIGISSGPVTPYGDIGLVNIGTDNSLVPAGTKPLHEPLLIAYAICGIQQRATSEEVLVNL